MTLQQLLLVARMVRTELASDYVGVWEIHRLLQQHGGASANRIAQIVEELLVDSTVSAGQFSDQRFIPWEGRQHR